MDHFTTRPELCGTFGAVASTHWIASAVAMRILEAGGNAFDAGACAGFVLQIVEPHLNGPGGDVPILVTRANDTGPTVICGQGPAPAAATIEHFQNLGLDLIPGTGLLAPCVPGAFGAWLTMLRDYGTVSVRDVLEPAIYYANNGHPILKNAVNTINSVKELFQNEWKTSSATFLPNGSAPEPGSLFTNKPLGAFYERVIKHAESVSGSREKQIQAAIDYWYKGEAAEVIERFCTETEALDVSGQRHRGLLTADDLNNWSPPLEKATSVTHGEYSLFKCGAWSQGPALLQAVQILQGSGIADYAPESADYVHLVTETIKLVMADRDAWYGDEIDVPMETLLSKDYANMRRSFIGDTASLEIRPGTLNSTAPKLPPVHPKGAQGAPSAIAGGGEPTMAQNTATTSLPLNKFQRGDTCHIDVVDRWGNMVSATPSGGWLQSNPLIPELGFALGTRMQMFWLQPGLPNSLKPGKRPRTTLTPSMAFKDGKPYLAFGTPGGDQQEQWSLQLWLNHIVHGRPLQQAIETPAFHTDHMIASFWPREASLGSLIMEERYDSATISELQKRGHHITVGAPWSEGRLSACSYESGAGGTLLRAGANPRGMQGYAIVR
ncbi:gamma-glutamyltransferase family protein [Kordiimonas pumila]|uniref:Gamma-glutamyltransferase family protein n=1 Tax=Kordiimonas pumila TaxID=2161677 RepID=A0ABV7D890_9PROT|nr:gamma-glutamyltransferase family protein [Kordiimonas pumila]